MAKKKTIRFIINPTSGSNRSEDKPKIISEHIDRSKYDYHCVTTEYKGHAAELSTQYVTEGIDVVVACGGDGTVNEVASSLIHTDTVLGIIPGGSGNGFAMHIGMGRNTAKAVQKLNLSTAKVIDSCYVNEQFFLNLAGIGFDALIAYKADNESRRGFQMYFNLVSKEILKFKAQKFKVLFDDQEIEGPFTSIAIANAAMYGYNFTVAPLAELADGLLDLVFIKEASILRTIGSSWRMLNKTIDKSSLVETYKTKEVTILTENPYYFHVDGESYEFSDKLHFKINPLSIRVLFPN